MNPVHVFKFRYEDKQIPHTGIGDNVIGDRLMLQLARMVIIVMMMALGFLLNSYLGSINKAIDNTAASLSKISDTQERLSVMLARIDVTVQAIDRRVNKTESRLEHMENKKP